jgi:hypothetical protein
MCTVVAYLLVAVTGLVGLITLLVANRTVTVVYMALELDKWGLAAANNISFILLGLIWLGGTLYTQHWYNQACKGKKTEQPFRAMYPRFLQATAIELAILAVALITQFMAE